MLANEPPQLAELFKMLRSLIRFPIIFYSVIVFCLNAQISLADIQEGKIALRQKNYMKAEKIFKSFANKGEPEAQHWLGLMYHSNIYGVQNLCESFKWIRLAAKQNYLESISFLATMYTKGDCVEKDDATAAMYHRMAAERGNASSQAILGMLYREGRGVKQDFKEAFKWLYFASEQGEAMAMVNLGARYSTGTGTMVDYKKAFMWNVLAHKYTKNEQIRLLAEKNFKELGGVVNSKDLKMISEMVDRWKPKSWDTIKNAKIPYE
jgi:hypothetical protein